MRFVIQCGVHYFVCKPRGLHSSWGSLDKARRYPTRARARSQMAKLSGAINLPKMEVVEVLP